MLYEVEGLAAAEILKCRTVFGRDLGLGAGHVIILLETRHRGRNDIAGDTDHDTCIGIGVDLDISLECTDEDRSIRSYEVLAEYNTDRNSLLSEAVQALDADLIDTGTKDLAFAGILGQLHAQELHHTQILVLGGVFILTDETTGLILMTAAETDVLGDIFGELAGLGLLDAGADGQLIACVRFVKCDTDIHAVDLDQEVTDKTEDIRVTGLNLYDRETKFTVKGEIIHRLCGDRELGKRQVRIGKTDDGCLVKGQSITHVSVERVIDFRELVGITVETIVESSRADRILVDVDAFITEQLPYECTAGADVRLDVGVIHIDPAELVMVDYGYFRSREETDITGTVLAVGGDQKITSAEIRDTVLDRDTEHLDHHGEINFGDLGASAVDQTDIAAMALEIPVEGKSGRDRIRIRVIMTLDGDVFILRQIRQFHEKEKLLPSPQVDTPSIKKNNQPKQ